MKISSLRATMIGAASAFAVLAFAPAQANAQIQVQANYNLDAEQLGFGAGYNFGLGSLTANNGITAVATFDYYLKKNNYTAWEANFNGKMDIKSVAGLYVGAGGGLRGSSFDDEFDICDISGADCSSTDFHINALTGWNFGSASKGPFVEAAILFGSGSSIRLGGGIRF